MKKLILTALLAVGGLALTTSAATADWGIRIGYRPAPRVVYVPPPVQYVPAVPVCPPPPVVVVQPRPQCEVVVPGVSVGFGWHRHYDHHYHGHGHHHHGHDHHR